MTRYGFQEAEIDSSVNADEFAVGSAAMQEVMDVVKRVAPTNAAILLISEDGCEQDRVAHCLHRLSRRASKPFLKIDCCHLTSLPGSVEALSHLVPDQVASNEILSEQVKWESANTGSLFLENIHALPVMLQSKLSNLVKQMHAARSDDDGNGTFDVRLISTSHPELERQVAAGNFDRELYYQLGVVPITIPPLRDRPDDIPGLVHHYMSWYANRNERFVSSATPETIQALQAYSWPGNLSELHSLIERAVVMAETDELTLDLFPDCVKSPTATANRATIQATDIGSLTKELVHQGVVAADAKAKDLHSRIVDRVEKELISQVLEACEFVQTKAATRLGINRNTLHKKMKEYKLDGLGQ
jgi:DNA-binding NtrC family response regulator